MKPLQTIRAALRLHRANSIALANNATAEADELTDLQSLCNADAAAFELANADAMFIPWSEVPNGPYTQVFDAEAGATLANVFNNADTLLGKMRNLLKTGSHRNAVVPVYIGHPDMPGSKDTDHAAKGWVKGVKALANGVELAVEWTAAGRALIAGKAFKFYSPYWDSLPVAGRSGAMRPVRLKSIGLCNNHNMAVRPLVNTSNAAALDVPIAATVEPTTEVITEPAAEAEDATAVLVAVRYALGSDPTADRAAVMTAIEGIKAKAEALPAAEAARDAALDELAAARAAGTAAQDSEATAKAEKAAAEQQATAANALANTATAEAQVLRARVIETRLITLQNNGKLIPANYNETLATCMAMANVAAIDEALTALANAAPSLKTEPSEGVAGAAGGKAALAALANSCGAEDAARAAARTAKLTELTAHFKKQGIGGEQAWNMAWTALRRDHAELL